MITVAIVLIGLALFCALIPEMRGLLLRFRRPRPLERHVIKADEDPGPRRARPKLKREEPPPEAGQPGA
jgi:hypothetical protein